MRFLIKASMPVETSNRMIHEGKLPQFIQSVLAEAKSEAAYFLEDQGKNSNAFRGHSGPQPDSLFRRAMVFGFKRICRVSSGHECRRPG
jgi:hypothetical protein